MNDDYGKHSKYVGKPNEGKSKGVRKKQSLGIFPLLVKVFSLEKKCKVDCVIVTTAHNEFKEMQLEDLARMMNDKLVSRYERNTQ